MAEKGAYPISAIIKRYDKNPILTKADVPYPVETVHNAGAVKHEGRYLLVFRSHRRNGRSILDRKSTRLNSSHIPLSRMPSSA